MTEAGWLTAPDTTWKLTLLDPRPSDRRLRLFSVACCDLLGDWFADPASSEAIRCAERFADGAITMADMNAAMEAALQVRCAIRQRHIPPGTHTSFDENYADSQPDSMAAWAAATVVRNDGSEQYWRMIEWIESSFPSVNFRSPAHCIFGNPFRPVAFSAWRSETVVALATAIYADRAFDHLPILADALEEAGCDNTDVLHHCRGPGSHVRGCWVVDGVLGKE